MSAHLVVRLDRRPVRDRAPLVAVFAAVAALASSCGAAEPQTRLVPEDQAVAERALLRPGDLAAGWSLSNGSVVPRPPSGCPKTDLSQLVLTGTAESDRFVSAHGTFASSSARVFEGAAANAFRSYTSDHGVACLKASLSDQLRETIARYYGDVWDVGDATFSEISLPPLGENSRAYRSALGVQGLPMLSPDYADVRLILIAKGHALVFLTFTSLSSDHDTKQEVAIAKAVASRL